MLSAQVMLRSASGKAPGGETLVTAENVHEYAPAPEAAEALRRAYAEAGFEVGGLVGNSFSVTGPAATFEKVFKVDLRRDEGRGVTARAEAGGEAGYEIPLEHAPARLARGVAAVTFTPPPDFGPTSFY